MKKLIAELPMLTAPKEKEELIIYMDTSKESISAVLMMKRDGKQMPIYFGSRALQGPEINYTPIEKLILSLMLSNTEVTGRLLKWSFELEEHNIHYRPRTSVKGQILADFIVERLEDDPSDTPIEDEEELPNPWVLFIDGSSCIDGSGAGLILTNPKGMEFTYALRFSKSARHDQILGEDEKEVLAVVEEEGRTWMTPIHEYLAEEILLEKKRKARAIRRKTEIYDGSCNMHTGPRSVVAKALRSGYYWPTMHADARKLIRECNSCQGIDIAGPFPEGPGKVKFLIVAIDYFTKWIEAKRAAAITEAQIKKFVWDNIVCRFGLPGEIVSDNEKQFRDNPFKDWSLGEGIKARLDERSKNWMEDISHVLWAHCTMIKSSNGETPFSLTYGTEAVIPVETGMPTLRTAEVDMIKNDEALEINLDLLEERREQAAIQEAKSKAKMEKYYNARVRNTSFKPGDLIYRNNEASRTEDGGKLGPKWEGPYEVTEALGK
ncbi:reverse transcriptase domain-containing protein [Tanacetum coccineum]